MTSEKQYIEAFNNGYILAQYEPNFSEILFQSLSPANNYLRGFFTGKEQFEVQRDRNRLYELQQLRNQSQEKEKGFEREK